MHAPAHAPLLHTNVQVLVACQSPAAEQVWTLLPEHWVAAGAHTPPHCPAPVQTNGHAVAPTHAPVASHVWGVVLPLHRDDPGTHVPAHAPAVQRNGQVWLVCH